MMQRLSGARIVLAVFLSVSTIAPATAASVDGIELYSTSSGTGPTIIFVHGWTCDTSSWREQMPAFADRYRVIALDLPGHGQSGSPAAGAFSIELFARAVEAVRAESGADRVVLVGHSMGAPVIRQYALDYPAHVAGLVAVDGPLDMRDFGANFNGGEAPQLTLESREAAVRGMFIAQTPPALQEHILSMMLEAPAATAQGAMNAMFDPALRMSHLIEAPALAVVAGTGQLPDVDALHEVLPKLRATQVAGTGHFLMMEKPAEFNRLLDDFLKHIGF